eukprot:5404845-Pleurochrysis_carterae.AAC.10
MCLQSLHSTCCILPPCNYAYGMPPRALAGLCWLQVVARMRPRATGTTRMGSQGDAGRGSVSSVNGDSRE